MTNKMLAVQNAVKTALESIATASGYNFNIGRVSFGVPSIDTAAVGGRPDAFIASLEEVGTIRPTSTVRKRLTFTVGGITQSDNIVDDLGTITLQLAADIEKCITTDVTLGTVVDYTQLERVQTTYFSESGKGVVTLEFFAEYPITLGSP